MNLKKSGRILWIVAAVAMLAMVLQGCGGVDDGVSPTTHQDLQDELAQVTAQRDALQATLGDETDPAADSVRGMLAAAQAEATMYMDMANALQTTLGDEMDPAADSVRGMLAAAQADVETYMDMAANLQTTLGDEMDPAADSVRGMLAAANADVETYMDMVDSLQTTLGDETDPAADSVRGMLAAANARIGSEDDPESLLGQIATLTARVADLEAGTAPDLIDPVKTAASNAADAAEMASGDAGMAADAAEMAAVNRATIQTGMANSVMDAATARMHADTAMTEAGNARTASDMAQAATSVDDATPHRTAAETAQANAETAKGMAEAARGEAVADAMAEVKVDGDTYSVGGTVLTRDGAGHDVTVNNEREITGLLDGMDIQTIGAAITGTAEETGPPVVAAIPGAAARTFDIGDVYDSADDEARLALITRYAGTDTVTAYEDGSGTPSGTAPTTIDHDNDADTDEIALRGAGTALLSSNLTVSGSIAADAASATLYSFQASDATEPTYVRRTGTSIASGTTTYEYQVVNIRTGAEIPAAADYAHLNFGVWAGLGDADATSGANDLADLGIGFVNALGAMTDVMPNHGRATYNGNWVATVQAADADGDGAITLQNGEATMEANFSRSEVDITLTGLATLEGDIDGNTFSGDGEATSVAATPLGGLTASADFDGSVQGAFFGTLGAEAGGVFDYSSDDNEDGAFRGAFGGKQAD